jgi:lambda repressor-like predicted transcriptional regulator
MTDTHMLMSLVNEKGVTKVALAAHLGLSRQGLENKLNNKYEFKQSEIEKITKFLGLTKEQERCIFFAA